MSESTVGSTENEKKETLYLVHATTASRRFLSWCQNSTVSSTCRRHPEDVQHLTNGYAGLHLFLTTEGEWN